MCPKTFIQLYPAPTNVSEYYKIKQKRRAQWHSIKNTEERGKHVQYCERKNK